jgi:hypothetical protein
MWLAPRSLATERDAAQRELRLSWMEKNLALSGYKRPAG